jgi:hypothetical protein
MSTEENIELPRGSYDLFTSIIKGFLSSGADKALISTKTVASYIGRHPTACQSEYQSARIFWNCKEGGQRVSANKSRGRPCIFT